MFELECTGAEEHYDELAIWRLVEVRKSVYRLPDDDPELVPWNERLNELAGDPAPEDLLLAEIEAMTPDGQIRDRKSTRLNSSHGYISYAVFCLKKKKKK